MSEGEDAWGSLIGVPLATFPCGSQPPIVSRFTLGGIGSDVNSPNQLTLTRLQCLHRVHRNHASPFTSDAPAQTRVSQRISAVGVSFVRFDRRENRRSIAILERKDIAHLGP